MSSNSNKDKLGRVSSEFIKEFNSLASPPITPLNTPPNTPPHSPQILNNVGSPVIKPPTYKNNFISPDK